MPQRAEQPLALVTGATGFVGAVVAQELARSGWRVRGLFRGAVPATWPGEAAHASDLLDAAAVESALVDVDAVVHLAARVHVMRDAASDPLTAYRQTNVAGTAVLLDAAERAGVRRFVFASSVKAVGEGGALPYDEETTPNPVDPYGISKLEAERLVVDFGRRGGNVATSLRFPLVYGPGVRANMLRLFQLAHRGVPLPFAAVRNRRSMLYVGNAATAIVTALRDTSSRRSPVYMVSDGEDVSSPELIRRIARALGTTARLIAVPEWVFVAAGRSGDVIRRAAPWPITSAAMSRLTGSLSVDSGRIRRELAFSPAYTMMEGIEDTARWFLRVHARRGAA